jgi:hypothetical protein
LNSHVLFGLSPLSAQVQQAVEQQAPPFLGSGRSQAGGEGTEGGSGGCGTCEA